MPLNDTMFARPPVYATAEDLAALQVLARRDASAPGAELLRQELRRLASAEAASGRFVRLGDVVCYRDLRTKRERRVRLVRPDETQADENWVSVLSPVGAALIGLTEGTVFRWLEPDGRTRAVKVLAIAG